MGKKGARFAALGKRFDGCRERVRINCSFFASHLDVQHGV